MSGALKNHYLVRIMLPLTHCRKNYLSYLEKSNGVLDVFKHVFSVRLNMTAAHSALFVNSLFNAVFKSLHLVYHNLQVGVGLD